MFQEYKALISFKFAKKDSIYNQENFLKIPHALYKHILFGGGPLL